MCTETSAKDSRKEWLSSSLGEHIYLLLEKKDLLYQCEAVVAWTSVTAKKQQREVCWVPNAKRSALANNVYNLEMSLQLEPSQILFK